MKVSHFKLIAIVTFLTPCALIAQAPAGSTGQCKDGTYTSAPSKRGACRGHQGVATWYASSAPTTPAAAATKAPASTAAAPAPAATPAPAPAPTPAAQPSAPKTASQSAKAAAPGGGPGLVWVNTTSNVYHCYGTKYYGTTKNGKYMTEADAKGAGAHPDHNQACSK